MTSSTDNLTLIDIRGAAKTYGAVQALKGVDVRISRGECLGLVGHNGAGKSTLVNVLCGALLPDSGALHAHGSAPCEGWSIRESRAWGLRCVFQELSLCANLTLAENMRIAQPSRAGSGWRARAGKQLIASLDDIFPGHALRPDQIVGELGIGKRQMVEIARAFTPGATPLELVVLDEPTSSLDGQASEQLLAYLRRFVASGKSCVLITHKLREIFAVTSRLVVMRDGLVVLTTMTRDSDREALVAAMGHETEPARCESSSVAKTQTQADGSVSDNELEVVNVPAGISGGLAIRASRGEVIGLAGLAGHGQTALLLRLKHTGHRDSVVSGSTAFVAGDRQTDGIFALWSIACNMTVGWMADLTRRGLIDLEDEQSLVEQWKRRLKLVTPDTSLPIYSLSGGNQQKVLFARVLGSSASVILMDDPMRGVDVGTKRDVYALIRDEASRGRTFLWYTTEFDELLHCDRVYVFNEGRAVGELSGDAVNEDQVVRLSFQEATA